jgi:hypothetical protein
MNVIAEHLAQNQAPKWFASHWNIKNLATPDGNEMSLK